MTRTNLVEQTPRIWLCQAAGGASRPAWCGALDSRSRARRRPLGAVSPPLGGSAEGAAGGDHV